MKSFVFDLKWPQDAPDRMINNEVEFNIPILPAFAIEYSDFSFTDSLVECKSLLVEGRDYILRNDKLVWSDFTAPLHKPAYRLTIYHHGIRDFSLLFPHVCDNALKCRLGRFYKEADTAFENGIWLSFALMCGALYEGLLFAYLEENLNFFDLINKAGDKEIIDSNIVEIMHRARNLRNLVHANNFSKEFVSRSDAMDMRKVMDFLIKMDWN